MKGLGKYTREGGGGKHVVLYYWSFHSTGATAQKLNGHPFGCVYVVCAVGK